MIIFVKDALFIFTILLPTPKPFHLDAGIMSGQFITRPNAQSFTYFLLNALRQLMTLTLHDSCLVALIHNPRMSGLFRTTPPLCRCVSQSGARSRPHTV